MLYPVRFKSGAAHNNRVAMLRGIAENTDLVSSAAVVPPFRYLRFERPAGCVRGWYIVDFGYGEVALEKGQVELMLLGTVAGLAIAGAVASDVVKQWVESLVQAFEQQDAPRPWTA